MNAVKAPNILIGDYTYIMGPAKHRISSVTTYLFNVFGGPWTERTPPHMVQLPHKGDAEQFAKLSEGYEKEQADLKQSVEDPS